MDPLDFSAVAEPEPLDFSAQSGPLDFSGVAQPEWSTSLASQSPEVVTPFRRGQMREDLEASQGAGILRKIQQTAATRPITDFSGGDFTTGTPAERAARNTQIRTGLDDINARFASDRYAQLDEAQRWEDSEAVKSGKATPEQAMRYLNRFAPAGGILNPPQMTPQEVGGETTARINNAAAGLVSGGTSPEALVTMALPGGLPAKLATIGWSAFMIDSAMKQINELSERWGDMSEFERKQAMDSLGLTAVFAGLTGAHVGKVEAPKADLSNIKPSKPLQLTREELQQLKSSLENRNPFQPKVPNETPNATPATPTEAPNAASTTSAEANAIPGKSGAATTEIPTASQPERAATPNGPNVPTGEGQASVPAAESDVGRQNVPRGTTREKPSEASEPLDFASQSEHVPESEKPVPSAETAKLEVQPPGEPAPAPGPDVGRRTGQGRVSENGPEASAVENPPTSVGPGAASPEQLRADRIRSMDAAMREREAKSERQDFEDAHREQFPDADPAEVERDWQDYQRARQAQKVEGTKPIAEAANEAVGINQKPPGEPKQTSIKKRIVNQERAARGVEPLEDAVRRPNPETWDAATRKLADDPQAGARLMAELAADPERAPTAEEEAILAHEKIGRMNEAAELEKAAQEAKAAGNDALVDEYRRRLAVNEAEQAAMDLLTQRGGTALGRGLQYRKVMYENDYSITSLERKARTSKNFEPLSNADKEEIRQQHDALLKSQQAIDEEAANMPAEYHREADKLLRQESAKPEFHPSILAQAEAIVKRWEAKADAARARLAGKLFSPTPEMIKDVVTITAARMARGGLEIAKWTAEQVAQFGEGFKPYADQIWKDAENSLKRGPEGEAIAPRVARAVRNADLPERITRAQEAIKAKVETGRAEEIHPIVQKLARMIVERDKLGIGDRDVLIDKIHDELKAFIPDISRREAAEALSGYGDYTVPAQDVVSKTIRSIKSQVQKVLGIEDILKKGSAERTGPQRDAMDQPNRALSKQVQEAKKKAATAGIRPTGDGLKTYLQTKETRLTNRIRDLQQEIADGKLSQKQRTPGATNERIQALEKELESVKAEHNAIFGKQMDDAARLRSAESMAERNEAAWQRKLDRAKTGDFGPEPTAPKQKSAKLDAIRQRTEAMKAERDELKALANPKATPEEIAIKRRVTQLQNQQADLADRLATGNFESNPRKAPVRNDKIDRLLQENAGIKLAIDRANAQRRVDTMTGGEKAARVALKLRRASILSGPGTLEKLGTAVAYKAVLNPLVDYVGTAIGHIPGLRQIAAKAQFQGGSLSLKAEASIALRSFKTGMSDALHSLKNRDNPLKLQYGKDVVEPRSWLDYMGKLHEAIKAPLLRLSFERAYEKGMEHEIANGGNPHDLETQMRVGLGAYKYAERQIFQQPNSFSKAIDAGIATLENRGHTGTAFVAKAELPVKTVPLNIAGEVLEHAFGLVTGSRRVARAYRNGLETLSQEEADIIMRQLKNGAVGNAAIALGFLAPQFFGGTFQKGEKRPKEDVQPGEYRIGDVRIPLNMAHNPLVRASQMGADFARVANEEWLKNHPEDKKGYLAGLFQSGEGLAFETPVFHELTGGTPDFSRKRTPETWLGNRVRDIAVPQAVQQPAKYFDQPPGSFGDIGNWIHPNTIQRNPTNFWDAIKTGIPGARETVQERK